MLLDHMVLLLSDLDASLSYYDKLMPLIGFTKTRDHVWSSPEGLSIDLRPASEVGDGYRRNGVGLNHLGFTAPSRGAIESIAKEMESAGCEVPDIRSFKDGPCALFLSDRDGIRFEITCYS